MTRPPLRLARPGQLPAPVTGDDSLQILSRPELSGRGSNRIFAGKDGSSGREETR
jgi:hypothetical protein